MHAIKAAKYSLLVLNVIVCLSGLVMLITGSVVQGEINTQKMSRTIGGYSTSAGRSHHHHFTLFWLVYIPIIDRFNYT